MVRTPVLAVIVTLAAGLTTPTPAQEAIFVVRHAEQTAPPDVVLTAAGHRRAAALALRLKDARINVIFTTTAVRTRETAEPTARALGLTPKVVAPQDIDGLVQRIKTEHAQDRVLIVNHSLNLPALLRALGHRDPPVIGPDDYDHLFIIVPRADGSPTVLTLRM